MYEKVWLVKHTQQKWNKWNTKLLISYDSNIFPSAYYTNNTINKSSISSWKWKFSYWTYALTCCLYVNSCRKVNAAAILFNRKKYLDTLGCKQIYKYFSEFNDLIPTLNYEMLCESIKIICTSQFWWALTRYINYMHMHWCCTFIWKQLQLRTVWSDNKGFWLSFIKKQLLQ